MMKEHRALITRLVIFSITIILGTEMTKFFFEHLLQTIQEKNILPAKIASPDNFTHSSSFTYFIDYYLALVFFVILSLLKPKYPESLKRHSFKLIWGASIFGTLLPFLFHDNGFQLALENYFGFELGKILCYYFATLLITQQNTPKRDAIYFLLALITREGVAKIIHFIHIVLYFDYDGAFFSIQECYILGIYLLSTGLFYISQRREETPCLEDHISH
ncbi:hypothetical protein OAT16_05320 [Prolixibacteraceae bacterium]|nr:hypothetical protein [Prolixibacteraceae bacterium]